MYIYIYHPRDDLLVRVTASHVVGHGFAPLL